jgi:hypothetical protein
MNDWKLWCIYRVSRGSREMVGTRVGQSDGEVLSTLTFDSPACFEAEECRDSHLYQRAVTYHEAMAGRKDIDTAAAKDHANRAKGLKSSLARLKSHAA